MLPWLYVTVAKPKDYTQQQNLDLVASLDTKAYGLINGLSYGSIRNRRCLNMQRKEKKIKIK